MSGRWVFCDFDGTIIVEEIFVELMQAFAPAAAARILPQIYALQVSLRAGLQEILEGISAREWPAMEQFVREQVHARAGFAQFPAALASMGWSLVVVTGGFARMAEMVLAPWQAQIHAIHGLEVDTQGEHLRLHSAWADAEEWVAKAQIYAHYAPEAAICIGDSVTDLRLARTCPRVFARDRLAAYLDAEERGYTPFDDFDVIVRALGAEAHG